VAVRVEWDRGGAGRLVSTLLDGLGGYHPGVVARQETRQFGALERAALGELLARTGFWELATEDPGSTGLDGARWIVEAAMAGRHHLVDRWSPRRGAVRELGESMLGLAGLTFSEKEIY
jgi:hypothetical protein